MHHLSHPRVDRRVDRRPDGRPDGRPDRGRGLSLVELMIGLTIMTIIGLAAVSFTTAVSGAWNASDDWQRTSMPAHVTSKQLDSIFETALTVNQVSMGSLSENKSASVLFWGEDNAGGLLLTKPGDGIPQWVEMQLLDFDPDTGELALYSTPNPSAVPLLLRPRALRTLSREEMADPDTVDMVRNAPWSQRKVLLRGAEAARFDFKNADDNTMKPKLAYAVRFNQDQAVRGVVTMKAAVDEVAMRSLSDLVLNALPIDLLPGGSGDEAPEEGGGLLGGFGGF